VFTKITAKKVGMNVEIVAEGTNTIDVGETFAGWTPAFVRPDGTLAPATILQFDTPAPGGKAGVFRIKYLALDPKGADKGDWRARSALNWTTAGGMGAKIKDSGLVTLPVP